MDKKVWFITGASRGLGLALIKNLLAAGHRVAAASKHLPELVETISKTPDAGFLPLEFDATDEAAVARSIHITGETFGRIDVLVNNAGYDAADPRETAAVIRTTLPWLRTQGSGHIINVNPTQLTAQYIRYPDVHITTVVTASSHTPEAAWDADAAQPTATRNTAASAAQPTATRNTAASAAQPAASNDMAALDPASTMTIPIDGKQIGDPQKAAAALIAIAELPEPPTRLVLATNAGNLAAAKMAELRETIKYWEARLNRQSLNCRIRPAQLSPLP